MMRSRETRYADEIKEGDRIEVIATVDKVETTGDKITVHFTGSQVLDRRDQVWSHPR
jgi:hypothetical protein